MKRPKEQHYARISISIPRQIWDYFEERTNSPEHSGNRSGYVRSLVVKEQATLDKQEKRRTRPEKRRRNGK